MEQAARIRVEVVFSPTEHACVRLPLSLPAGSTVAAALRLARADPTLGVPALGAIGIYGQPVKETTELRDGDRVELYRSLRIDPKDARRARAGITGKR